MLPDGTLVRPRLTAAVHAGVTRGILVVSAPVGFGATTVVAQAVADSERTAWVNLDALDAEPMALAVQLAHAIGGVTGTVPHSSSGNPLELVAAVVAEIDRAGDLVLVLDGVDARAHRGAHEVVAYLSASLPDAAALIVTTHDHVGTLPLPALSGRLATITHTDLALLPEEATQVVVDACPGLTVDLVDELVATAAGWAAPLREAAVQAGGAGSSRPAEWLTQQGCDRLASAALATTTDAGAHLLLESAFLDDLNAPLCDAVLGATDSAVALADLHDFGSLVWSAGPTGTPSAGTTEQWVRHPLLTVGLRRRTFGRDFSEQHRRAADWYRSIGAIDGTMNHLVAAGDFAAAGTFLSLHEDALYESGEVDRAAAWYVSLPAEAWGRRGWHLLRTGWGEAFTGDVRGAEVTLERLRAHLAQSPALHPEEATLYGETELLASYLAAMRGDADATVRHAARAVDLADANTPPNSVQLAPVQLLRGLLWREDIESAERQLARIDHQVFPTDLLREAALGAQRARILLLQGRVTLALQRARHAAEWLSSQSLDAGDVGQHSLMTTLVAATVESGHPDGAAGRLESIAASALQRAHLGDAVDALRWQARTLLVLGDLPGALACVGRARTLLLEGGRSSSMARPLDLVEAWVRYLAGDDVRAERLVQGLPRGDARTLMWVRLTMDRQGSRALGALAEVSATVPRHAAEKQVLLARAAMRRSTRLAEGHLIQAADIAGEHGLGLVFVGAGRDLVEQAILLGSRAGHDALVALASAARDGFRSGPDPSAPTEAGVPVDGRRALSPGEIQLLAFLPSRDSNDDIARRLGVSVNTIKTRLSRLYRKLDVANRDEAVAVARRRGLIA